MDRIGNRHLNVGDVITLRVPRDIKPFVIDYINEKHTKGGLSATIIRALEFYALCEKRNDCLGTLEIKMQPEPGNNVEMDQNKINRNSEEEIKNNITIKKDGEIMIDQLLDAFSSMKK